VHEYDSFGGTDMHCELHVCKEDIQLDDACATALFRIVQESLTNVVRHAHASKVDISLGRNEANYLLEVKDNGQGFEPAIRKEKSFGLLGIRERALALGGEVDISSVPGQGTSIRVSIPIHGAVSTALSES
jgi:signal transduction histidine kinase